MSFPIGTRVRLVDCLDIFNLGYFPGHSEGTVISHGDGDLLGEVKMDDHFDDLNEWGNVLQIVADDMGEVNWSSFEAI